MVRTVSVKLVRLVQIVAGAKPAVMRNAHLAMIVPDSHVRQALTAEVMNIVAEEHVVITIAPTTTLFGSFLV